MNKLKILSTGLLLVALVMIPTVALAQNSRLTQDILAVDCVANPTDVSCPPTIHTINVNDGRPTFAGTYNSGSNTDLKVTVDGVVYELGVSPELTASGDDWVLDLSGLEPPLEPGSYTVVVESLNTENNWLTTTASFNVLGDDDDDTGDDDGGSGDGDGSGGDNQGDGSLIGDLTDTGQPIFWVIVGGVVVALAGIVLMVSRKKQPKNN